MRQRCTRKMAACEKAFVPAACHPGLISPRCAPLSSLIRGDRSIPLNSFAHWRRFLPNAANFYENGSRGKGHFHCSLWPTEARGLP
jgi:hypothetical protein